MQKSCLLLLFLLFVSDIFSQGTVRAEQIGNRVDFSIEGMFFTSYRFADDEKYPYFFPVNGPVSGSGMTTMRDGLWPHHSSLFFGCDLVNGGNYWQDGLKRGRIVSLGVLITENNGPCAIVENDCIWKRPDAAAPIMDHRRITVSNPSKDIFFIDFDVVLEMLTDVVIQKTNHSLFSVRIAPDLSPEQGGIMVNAEGRTGEKGTFGQSSPWIDCSNSRKTNKEGIAVFQHPSNEWFPSPWFTRDYGFISPTPFYWPENDIATELQKGETISLRYRVVVHSGDAETAKIDCLYSNYCEN